MTLSFVTQLVGEQIAGDGPTSSIYIGGKPAETGMQPKAVHTCQNGTYRGMFPD
ncbi:hypothetical protein [Natronincola ferrireducens]|uniref:hypothetical protein n=1 Tax=Natronincola ferrireducens TaxID=393762 RepID=UPI00159FFB3B|nr:hypothetical protein [Natronincola ferrireducens]